MGQADHLELGTWNAICDLCGRKFKAHQLRKNWKGQMVCERDFETRHPQDYVRARAERPAPPWTRPDSAPEFLYTCTPNGSSAVADAAVADCAIADYVHPAYDPNVTE